MPLPTTSFLAAWPNLNWSNFSYTRASSHVHDDDDDDDDDDVMIKATSHSNKMGLYPSLSPLPALDLANLCELEKQ